MRRRRPRRRRRRHFILESSMDAAAASFDSLSSSSSSSVGLNETAVAIMQQQQDDDDDDDEAMPLNQTSTDTVMDKQATSTQQKQQQQQPSSTTTTAPAYRELLVFTFTTMLIWLSEPLLSLVDTTVVGLTQGSRAVTQLASLGPATTLLDSLLYLTYFLAIGTTNQIAAYKAVGNVRALQRTTSHTLGLATVLGLLTTAAVWLFATPILTNMAGAAATPALVSYAVAYSRIRAAASGPAVVGMVAQAVCLATLDPPCAAIPTKILTAIITYDVVPVLSPTFCACVSVVFGHH